MIVQSALIQNIVFFPLVLGIFLSYKILKTTDLTVDGSFVLGGAIYARLLLEGVSPSLALIVALSGGFLAGVGVALIQYKDRVNALIAGILALFMLYSINFQVMGRPNINLYNLPTLANEFGEQMVLMVAFLSPVVLLLVLFSPFGLKLRAIGLNKHLARRIGLPVEKLRIFGLGLSNALASFCGLLSCQINGYADVNMGFGVTLIGIGAVVIGLELMKYVFQSHNVHYIRDMAACFIGGLLYFMALNILLKVGVDPIHLKLCLGLSLVFFLRAAKLTTNMKVSYG